MSSRRSRWNAILKRLAQTDTPDTRRKITREEWVILVVKKCVGTRARDGILCSDDVASDILLKLIDAHGLGWGEDEIIEFCRRQTTNILLKHERRTERPESEWDMNDYDEPLLIRLATKVAPMQEIIFMANQSLGLLRSIPERHRKALEILCDGGNPLNIAEELDIDPGEAMCLIREAREYIQRVDPS